MPPHQLVQSAVLKLTNSRRRWWRREFSWASVPLGFCLQRQEGRHEKEAIGELRAGFDSDLVEPCRKISQLLSCTLAAPVQALPHPPLRFSSCLPYFPKEELPIALEAGSKVSWCWVGTSWGGVCLGEDLRAPGLTRQVRGSISLIIPDFQGRYLSLLLASCSTLHGCRSTSRCQMHAV